MCELVNDDVVVRARHRGIVPGDEQWPASPGFTGQDVGVFVHHAGIVHFAAGDDEFVRIDDDADPVTVGGKPQFQDGKAALGGDGHADGIGQNQAACGRKLLAGKEGFAQGLEPGFFLFAKYAQERVAFNGAAPERPGNWARGLAQPARQPCKHAHLSLCAWSGRCR